MNGIVLSAEQRLLYGFFENYLRLNKEEEGAFMQKARELEEADEILEIPISYEERGKKIGREEGKEKEKLEVARGLLKEGVSQEIIMKTTKLNFDELEKLKQQMS